MRRCRSSSSSSPIRAPACGTRRSGSPHLSAPRTTFAVSPGRSCLIRRLACEPRLATRSGGSRSPIPRRSRSCCSSAATARRVMHGLCMTAPSSDIWRGGPWSSSRPPSPHFWNRLPVGLSPWRIVCLPRWRSSRRRPRSPWRGWFRKSNGLSIPRKCACWPVRPTSRRSPRRCGGWSSIRWWAGRRSAVCWNLAPA